MARVTIPNQWAFPHGEGYLLHVRVTDLIPGDFIDIAVDPDQYESWWFQTDDESKLIAFNLFSRSYSMVVKVDHKPVALIVIDDRDKSVRLTPIEEHP